LLCVSLSRKYPNLSLKPEKYQKLCKLFLEREEGAIYMGQYRARSLKRTNARLSDHLENLPLANGKLPRGTLSSEDDELRLSVPQSVLVSELSFALDILYA